MKHFRKQTNSPASTIWFPKWKSAPGLKWAQFTQPVSWLYQKWPSAWQFLTLGLKQLAPALKVRCLLSLRSTCAVVPKCQNLNKFIKPWLSKTEYGANFQILFTKAHYNLASGYFPTSSVLGQYSRTFRECWLPKETHLFWLGIFKLISYTFYGSCLKYLLPILFCPISKLGSLRKSQLCCSPMEFKQTDELTCQVDLFYMKSKCGN